MKPTRDPLLDGLRAAALGRVLLWHALAWFWLSWVFPAMPVMFFLAGSLLASSLDRGGFWGTVVRRWRRLLVPFWVFGAVVLATTVLTARRSGEPVVLEQWWRWILPLVPPEGAAGQQGWLTSHLWYVSDYLWLVLLAPVVVRAARRPVVVGCVALVGLVALEFTPLTGGLRTGVGDVLCYGTFAVLGAASARVRPRRVVLAVTAVVAFSSAVALTWVVPLDRGSLNSSYLLLALAALGWLAALGVVEEPLRRLAVRGEGFLRKITSRAVTIYLWHPAAIVLARTAVDTAWPEARLRWSVPLVVLGAVVGTAVAVLAVGWVEDLAAGRRVRRFPVRLVGAAAPVTAGCAALVVAFTGGPSPSLLAIPGPSDRSALQQSAFDRVADPEAVLPTREAPLTELPVDDLQRALDEWVAVTDGIDAASVGLSSGTVLWEGTTSVAVGEGLAVGEPVLAASLTKGVTAALVLQEAALGGIDLDAPVPDLDGIPAGTALTPRPTPRQLLHHAAGLPQYTDAPGYDAEREYTPAELVTLALDAPSLFAPGTQVNYSNSGFLWLGLLLEDVTGSSYAELVTHRIALPLGLSTMTLEDTVVPGWVGFSSGGIVASPGDLARWQDALFSSDLVLDTASRAELMDLRPLNNGLGVWPFCPCGTDEDGGQWAMGWGQVVNSGGALAYPAEHVAVMAYLQPEGARATETMPELAETLLTVLPGRL